MPQGERPGGEPGAAAARGGCGLRARRDGRPARGARVRKWSLPGPFRGMSVDSAQSGFVSPVPHVPGYRTDIEGLRGVAVLLVVLYHAGVPGFGGGFVGVDVFFVLSGYLITGLLVKEIEGAGRLDLWTFYARRARRLLPAAALVIVATLAAAMVLYSPMEQTRLAHTALAAVAYASNLWFALRSTDYFAESSETNPLLHTWSLSVEEQFYIVWPVLVMLALRGTGSRGRLLAVMAGLSVLSLAGSVWLTQASPAWAFYGAPTRAWEFGVGGIAALLSMAALRTWPGATRMLGWLGLLAIGAATAIYTKHTAFPGFVALLPVGGTIALLLAGAVAPGAGVGRVLDAAPLQRLGRLSYSWYLWHWPVLVMAAAVVPDLSLAGRLACVGLSLGLAALTYALVENPIRVNQRLALRPAYSLGLAVLLMAGGGGASLAVRQSALETAASPAHQIFVSARWDRPRLGDCNANWGVDEARECVFGDTASVTTVALFGDSHAAHWAPAFEALAHEQGWRLVTLTKNACPAAAVPFNDPRSHHDDECSMWRTSALERLEAIRPDIVVLGNATTFYPGITFEQWRTGFRATLGTLDSASLPTLVLWGSPSAPLDIPECLSRAVVQRRDPNSLCAFGTAAALHLTSYHAASEVASELARVRVADLSAHFCDETECRPIVAGVVVLYDRHHLTASMAGRLVPILNRHVVELLGAVGG
jgi:peptidoglycan/LPS O-acetylase OafA/YrhL